MRNLVIVSVAALLTSAIVPALAEGQHNGWDPGGSTTTNGNSGQLNGSDANNGTTTTYDPSGPKGQIKNGNDECNNCTPAPPPDLPGKKR
jgi:hypothetical protein